MDIKLEEIIKKALILNEKNIVQAIKEAYKLGKNKEMQQGDITFSDVVNFVKTKKNITASALQRKFKIGYVRTVKLLEKLEKKKIITPLNKKNVRKVI